MGDAGHTWAVSRPLWAGVVHGVWPVFVYGQWLSFVGAEMLMVGLVRWRIVGGASWSSVGGRLSSVRSWPWLGTVVHGWSSLSSVGAVGGLYSPPHVLISKGTVLISTDQR